MNINAIAKSFSTYQSQKRESRRHSVRFFNFWQHQTEDNWFYKFIYSRNLLKDCKNLKINFFSVFGSRLIFNLEHADVNVFFSGENVQIGRASRYRDYALNKNIDLALGMEYIIDERYLRFPLWILYMFPPDSTDQDIVERCHSLSNPKVYNRTKFACHISKRDSMGIRGEMVNEMSGISMVDCGGAFMHNDDDLHSIYHNNKIEYLQRYAFNICPENSNCEGYVTEKLFQAIEAGCIPVYWGSNNHPEPSIVNPGAVFFWKPGDANSDLIQQIRKLMEKPELLLDYLSQPRLLPDASDHVIVMMNSLEKRLKELFCSL